MDSWSKLHTWLTFRTLEFIGEVSNEVCYVMDLSAPQFGAFGEKITVHESIPDVFITTAMCNDSGEAEVRTQIENYNPDSSAKEPCRMSICMERRRQKYRSWLYGRVLHETKGCCHGAPKSKHSETRQRGDV